MIDPIYKDFHRSKYLQLCIIRFYDLGMSVDTQEDRIVYCVDDESY